MHRCAATYSYYTFSQVGKCSCQERMLLTRTSLRKMNFQPQRWARTATSMSSTVVRSNHPPHSSSALIRHTPAVPLKPKKLRNTPLTCCSTSKWNDRFMFWRRVSKFSSLFTNDHRACTKPSSGFSCHVINLCQKIMCLVFPPCRLQNFFRTKTERLYALILQEKQTPKRVSEIPRVLWGGVVP